MDKKIEESFKNILKPFQQITDIVLEKSGFRKPLDKIYKKKLSLLKIIRIKTMYIKNIF